MSRTSPMRIAFIVGVILLFNVIGAFVSRAPQASSGADGRSLRWERYDVLIDNVDTAGNRFDVTESYELAVALGPYSFGFAEIPQGRLESIDSVTVSENGTALTRSCSGAPGTFCAQDEGDNYSIQYYFRSQIRSGEQRNIDIGYSVHGGLRSYKGGDQLYWKAIPSDRAFDVRQGEVKVVMPPDYPPEKISSYPKEWPVVVDGLTVTWTVNQTLPPGDEVEVRVQYPHNPAMAKPSWQARYDLQRSYEDNWKPLVGLFLFALGAFVAIAGVFLVFTRYMSHGRDPKALVVPEYLSEPPSDERPGMVGVLLDETADMKDIMATLIDLARQGYVVIEQSETGGIAGMFTKQAFTFHRTDKAGDDLREYEQTLLRGLFPGGRKTTDLSDLRAKFYTHIPAIKHLMYRDLVASAYFDRSPETTRQWWTWGGIAVVVIASGLFWLALQGTAISPWLVMPPIGLGVVGAVAAITGSSMPAKTVKGAQEAARWRAFRRYLDNIRKYSDLEEASRKFEDYLGFAVAFGLEREWIRELSPVLTSMPTWYFPTYLGGPWYGGYRGQPVHMGGPAGGLGNISLGRPGGLNDVSRSLTQGLNAMSSGMTQMLNDASRVMTSRPQSSGSSRGGGFSGGGFGGGGGGGGGSRGFG